MSSKPNPRRLLAAAFLLSAVSCGAALDQDGGGLSDFWQQMYPGLDPAADSDGDGSDNATEAVAGTDPLDAASGFKLDAFGKTPGEAEVFFQWQAVKGKAYTVERFDPQAGTWSAVATTVATAAGPGSQEIPATDPSGIFRLRVADHDGDGDGLTAWEEGLLGYSDESATSSGQAGRQDFSAGLRALEGTGMLSLAGGGQIPKRPPVHGEVVRFLVQASFGADPDLIDHVMAVGIGGWMDEQLNPAVTTMTDVVMRNNGGGLNGTSNLPNTATFPTYWSMGWWKAAMTGPDQLRLRIGNALSQIFVISTAGSDQIRQNSYSQADYYDILLQHALGNYRNLLEDVSYATQMGLYLSHLQNRKSDLSIGRFPDENYAREIMQLFSIGLWKLNPDGTRMLDVEGNAIPTYDNTTIMEMAKIFTGLGIGGPNGTGFFSPVSAPNHLYPMQMWDAEHEPGEKHIVNGVVIPAGQTGVEDIDDALDALAGHPNTGPFFSRLLIQRFTSSNPSPAYLRRVASVWADNGSGARGDLKAVMEAILMDPEARSPDSVGEVSGKVREPYLRLVAMLRAFKAKNGRVPSTYPVYTPNFIVNTGQQPLGAPSVFNFYLPDHRPAGELRDNGLFSPELEIATAERMIKTDNATRYIIDVGMTPFYSADQLNWVRCDFTYELALATDAANIPALVDHLDSLLCWGTLSSNSRQAIITAVQAEGHISLTPAQNAAYRVKAAVHLIVESPDFVVLK